MIKVFFGIGASSGVLLGIEGTIFCKQIQFNHLFVKIMLREIYLYCIFFLITYVPLYFELIAKGLYSLGSYVIHPVRRKNSTGLPTSHPSQELKQEYTPQILHLPKTEKEASLLFPPNEMNETSSINEYPTHFWYSTSPSVSNILSTPYGMKLEEDTFDFNEVVGLLFDSVQIANPSLKGPKMLVVGNFYPILLHSIKNEDHWYDQEPILRGEGW